MIGRRAREARHVPRTHRQAVASDHELALRLVPVVLPEAVSRGAVRVVAGLEVGVAG